MMDETTTESCVPPGFRFHPTDEELVGYYLRKKIASQKIDLDVIRDIDLYRIEPWDLQDKCGIGYEEQNEWYFFSHKDKKYPTGTRTNRATMAGFWKATGRDKAVYDKTKLIGMRKTLVFYKGRAPNGQKSDWIMHEYRLESEENGLPQEEGWVVCRAFKKRSTGQTKNTSNTETWDSTYYYDHNDSTDYMKKQQMQPSNFASHNLMCKQEIEPHFVRPDGFVQLPDLESPSLLPMKRPSSISLASDINNNSNNNNEDEDPYIMGINAKKVTDWRDLDKFVASQLSHGDRYEEHEAGSSNFESTIQSDSDLGFLMFESGRDEGPKLVDELSTNCDGDIGICIFNK